MKLFVSHSSKTPANLALLQEICTELRQREFDVLVDRGGQLYAGLDWDLRINEWMGECHAAVILVSTAALRESDWVKKEATVLSWRREQQEDFKLIPVLLEDVTPEDLEHGLMGVLRITKSQCIRNARDAQQIAAEIEAGLGPAYKPALTPFERLENVLIAILENQATPLTLEDAWRTLDGAHKPQWQPNSGRRFATALTRLLLRDSRHALKHLKTVLDCIRPRVQRSAAEELLKYLACLWVDTQAASGITAAAHGGGIVGLNGQYLPDFTARRYGERAWPLRDQWRFVSVDATQRTFHAIQETIRESFRPRSASVPDASIDRRIAQYQAPILVLIPSRDDPAQLPDEALLAELRRSYPNLIYLIGTGANVPDWVPEPMMLLLPALDLDLEEDQFLALHDTKNFINSLHRSP